MKIIEAIISAIVLGVYLLRGRAETAVIGPMTDEEVTSVLAAAAKYVPDATDWRSSIVDLMKILHMDSSLKARKALARELAYNGSLDDSVGMNTWLHQAVMDQVARRIVRP